MAKRLGLTVLTMLLGLGVGTASAEDGAPPPASGDCSFPCLFRAARPAQAAAAPVEPAQAPEPAPSDALAVPKAAPKPAVHALTIVASAPEVPRLKALSGVLPGQPVKIVKAPASGTASALGDFSVKTVLQAESSSTREAKLFTEHMMIVAADRITRVEDLRGRVVSFGAAGSSGEDAARKAFQALGISVKETPLDLDNALDGVATGDLDAVVVLAPQPFDRLKTAARTGLHLLSWPQGGALPAGASAAMIAADQYPGLAKPGETIRVVAVDAVLSISPKGARQPSAKRFLTALAQHSAALSKRGFDLIKADLDSRTARRVALGDGR